MSQSLLYQGFVSTPDPYPARPLSEVSIPSLSGLRFNECAAQAERALEGLNPFFIRASFQQKRSVAWPLRVRLNPFFIRASFQRGCGPTYTRTTASQSLLYQGFVSTSMISILNVTPVSIPSLSGLRFNSYE